MTGIASGNLFGLLKADVIRIALLAAMLLFVGMLIRYSRRKLKPLASSKLFAGLNLFMALWFVGMSVDRYAIENNPLLSCLRAFLG
ncbi:MAG TPA: hypothetical protein VJ440_10870 [Candidatus Brocadiaceae bacterium]|nr:hypothetical protein [Candidatus Brocadiaceae bacterium]